MDKAFFVQRYVVEGKSYSEIAKELGWSKSSVGYYLKKYDIQLADHKVRQREKTLRGENHPMFGKPGTLTGRHHSDETKKKIGAAHLGVPEPPVSEETRKKLSAAQKKRPRKPDSERKTPLYRAVRILPEYKMWRTMVYERDGYTCQECQTRGGELNADHVVALSAIMRTYNVKTVTDALACKELWDLDNGVTLCVPCHKRTPTYGGGSKVRK